MHQIQQNKNQHGFTLIELSIVLVIIGLIVGGLLVGQDLIRAAETRAQLTQIEKYNSATNTFRSKFNALPGDMRPEIAQQYGFTQGAGCNGTVQGRRNGDGLIDGNSGLPLQQGLGEVAYYWIDLSSPAAGNLIEGQFPGAGAAMPQCGVATVMTLTGLGNYFPYAKIGHNNIVYVYEMSGSNWFGLSAGAAVTGGANLTSGATISVIQAYNMDIKVDDGNPTTGNVVAVYLNGSSSAGSQVNAANAASDNVTSCYNAVGPAYSITYNNGNGGNCALSFRFQ